jgi:hypothetical protein
MSTPDIAAIVTIHGESVLAAPTVKSAEVAAAAAEKAGYSVERLIGLDAPTAAARAYFSADRFAGWPRSEVACRDQGLARNAFVRQTRARWIAFLDGDDLWSENWLVEAARLLEQAENAGEGAIVHPEVNWFFDKEQSVIVNIDQDDPLFSPAFFYFGNYYDALAAAPRAAHLDHPYPHRDLEQGFAVEDWQWSIETMADGWTHRIAPGTIIFKRRREQSQTIEASRRAAVTRQLPALRIDLVEDLGKARRARP